MNFSKGSNIPFAVDIHGVTYPYPSEDDLESVIDSLEDIDFAEFDDIWLNLPTTHILTYSASNVLILEKGEDQMKVIRSVDHQQIMKIWQDALKVGASIIDQLPWETLEEMSP